MNREAGRSYLIPFLFVPKFVYGPPGGSRQWAWRSKGGAGNPSAKNIERYVHKHNESLEADGVNSHLGRRDAIYGGSIVDQKTGETVAEWENKGIIQFYKNKPMFEVVGLSRLAHELVKMSRELVSAAGPLTLLEELKSNIHKLEDDKFLEMTSNGWGHTPGVDYIFGTAGNDIAHAVIGFNVGNYDKARVIQEVKKNIERALKDNEPFKGLRGEQKETHELWFKMMKQWKKNKYKPMVD